jgi:hypothetical protein
LILLAASVTISAGARAPKETTMRTRLLSVGVNHTPLSDTTLRFAERDAQRLAQYLASSRGPTQPEDATVLLGAKATIKAVRDRLDLLVVFPPENLIIGFSGHGGYEGVGLADELLSYDELGSYLNAIEARTKTAILGTCHAGSASCMFETRVAGVGGVDAAWRDALLAACPGLRLIAAVGPNDLAHDDPNVRGSRFHFGLFQALTCAHGDILRGGRLFISDVSVIPRVRTEIVKRWPNEALPYLVGPSGRRSKLPLMLSQAEQPFGWATVSSITPGSGTTVHVVAHAYERRFVQTYLEVGAYADDDSIIDTCCVPFLPMSSDATVERAFTLGEGRLLEHPRAGAWLRLGLTAGVTWQVRVRDEHNRTLDIAQAERRYWRHVA